MTEKPRQGGRYGKTNATPPLVLAVVDLSDADSYIPDQPAERDANACLERPALIDTLAQIHPLNAYPEQVFRFRFTER